MRIIKKGISRRNGEGFVRLQADEPDDMYHLYNLICEGDVIRADTIRNVRSDYLNSYCTYIITTQLFHDEVKSSYHLSYSTVVI